MHFQDRVFDKQSHRGELPEYLVVTPFCNGGDAILNALQGAWKFVVSCDKTDDEIAGLLSKKMCPPNLFFNNACNISSETKALLRDREIGYSFFEAGWFPHYRTWGFDPEGWLDRSMLATSRLDHLPVEMSKVCSEVEAFKEDFEKEFPSEFSIPEDYLLLVLQYAKDASIIYGYPDFEGWQRVIDFAHSLTRKGEILVVKMHPINAVSEKVIFPMESIAVQSKRYNGSLIRNARAVVGVNSTMLYEASILYEKPVLALGNGWFDAHPEVVMKVSIEDPELEAPAVSPSDIAYRRKMFAVLKAMQSEIRGDGEFIDAFLRQHHRCREIERIEDWFVSSPAASPLTRPPHPG